MKQKSGLELNGRKYTDVIIISVIREVIAETGKLDKIYMATVAIPKGKNIG